MDRIQKANILHDLQQKMVLLAGPRQAGKTWLAKEIGKKFEHTVYLNCDSHHDRKIILEEAWLSRTELLILDELHKIPDWKNLLKGIYDTKRPRLKILVTGSARLELFSQAGDSLAGRYFLHRLMPLSMAELKRVNITATLDRLLKRSGFPEPYLAESDNDAERWRMQYINSLLTTDVLDFDGVQNLNAMRLILEMLQQRVGSPISFRSIAEDVQISPNTVRKYIQILEALYIIFRITPYSRNIARSLIKEPKIYFFDTGMVKGDEGMVFENLVAMSLLKHVYGKIDYEARPCALHYIRTKDGEEIDFALVDDGKIEKLVEVKYTNHKLHRTLLKFSEKYQYPAVQVVKDLKRERQMAGIEIVRGENFLEDLYQ